MADIYKIKWQQSQGNQGETPQNQTFKVGTDNTIKELNPLNSNWSSAGCYAGANAQNGSLMGSSSTLVFTGWNSNQYYSDLRNFQIQPSIPSSQQNLRFMAKFSTSSTIPIVRQAFNWTGLTDGLVSKINEAFANSSTSIGQLYDPYKLDLKTISMSGTSNTPLNVAPLNELKINNLIFVPYFIVKSVEYYDVIEDLSDLNAYKNVTYGNVGIYTWDQIKPEDKSEEGSDYNSDLFTKGYEANENPTHEDGLKFNYVAGCVLVPYYGKSSKVYNSILDSYTEAISPDDQKVYGERRVFGSLNSDANEYPTVYSTTQPRPNLIVLTEFASSVTGGTVYSTPAGVTFMSASPVISSLSGNDYTLEPNIGLDQTYQKFTANNNWSPFYFTGNADYCNFYKDYNPDSPDRPSPDLVIPATHMEITNDIIGNLPDTTPTGTIIYLPDNSIPYAFSWSRNTRSLNSSLVSFFSIQELWATIASLGCYVADNISCAQNAPTGAYVGQNNHLYLGYMDASGITNGTMLQGIDIANSTQSRIDDIIQDTPYVPVIPTPGGGGGGDYPGPNPSGENQPNYKGDDIPARTDRNNLGNIGASATYYVLSDNLMGNFNNKLWGQPSDFYEALQFTLDATPSIFDYIISCTYYPLDLSAYKGAAQQVYMGTGAKFGLNEYVLNTLSATLDFGSISLTDSVFHPYEGNEAFLNLNPYTKISITIPYAGSYDLNASEVAGGTLALTGDLSFITGKITYTLMLTTAEGSTYPILKHSAKIGCDMKLSGADGSRQAAQMVSAGINWGKSLLSTTGSLLTNGEKAIGSSLIGDVGGAASGLAGIANSVADFTADTASFALSSKEIPLQVGNSDGFDAIFSTQVAYITVYRPKISNPPNYGHTTGYLTEGTSKISSLTGFTICRNPDVSGINATQDEKSAIQSILTSGFYA